MDDNKAKALTAALSQIEKQFGKNTIMRLGDESAKINVDVVSQAHWVWILRWASAVCQRVVSSKFMVLKVRVKPL